MVISLVSLDFFIIVVGTNSVTRDLREGSELTVELLRNRKRPWGRQLVGKTVPFEDMHLFLERSTQDCPRGELAHIILWFPL